MGDGKLSNLEALRRVWSKDVGLSVNERAVTGVLVMDADRFEVAGVSQSLIAAETGMSLRSVRKVLADLERKGIVIRSGGPGRAVDYTVSLDNLPRQSVQGCSYSPNNHPGKLRRGTPANRAAPANYAGVVLSTGTSVSPELEKKKENPPKGGKKKERGCQLPEAWTPSEKHHALATKLGVDIDLETEQFTDHHTARGSVFKDWDAAFRTWLRNAKRYNGNRKPLPTLFSESVVSVDDIRRCVLIAGSTLGMRQTWDQGYRYIEEKDPTLWTRAGETFQRMDAFSLYKAKDRDFTLTKAIESQLATLRNGHA